MNKYILFLITLLLSSDYIIGQRCVSNKRVKEIKEQFAGHVGYWIKKDLIFEGTILERKRVKFLDTGSIFSDIHHLVIYKVLVHKLFKGNLEKGTVEIINTGVSKNGHGETYEVGQSGIFSGSPSSKSGLVFEQIDYVKQLETDNEQYYYSWISIPYETSSIGDTYLVRTKNYLSGKFMILYSAKEVYAFLESYEGNKKVVLDTKIFGVGKEKKFRCRKKFFRK